MSKYEEAIKIVIGVPLTSDYKVNFIEKVLAVIGLNPHLGYCPKHKIFFWQSSELFTITVCPKCARERNFVVGATGK